MTEDNQDNIITEEDVLDVLLILHDRYASEPINIPDYRKDNIQEVSTPSNTISFSTYKVNNRVEYI